MSRQFRTLMAMLNDASNRSCGHHPEGSDIHARLDALSAALHEAQREIDALRRRRARPSAGTVAVLLTVATGTFGLSLSGQSTPLQSGSFWAPFEVFGDDRRTVLRVESVGGRASVSIGTLNGGGVSFGVDRSGAGFLAVRGADGTYSSITDAKGIQIMTPDGKTAAASLGLDGVRKQPLLRLGDDKTGGVDAGAGASGTGFLVVRTGSGQPGISLGQRDKSPLSVTVHDASGANSVAQLGADGSGAGRLLVRGEGRSVATLGPSQLGQLGLTIGTNEKAPGAAFGLLSDGTGQAVLAGDGGGEVVVGGYKTGPVGMRLLDSSGGERVTIATGEKGAFGVTVAGPGQSPVARIGEASVGGGVVATYNSAGTIGAIVSGTGQIHVANNAGQTFATMVAENNQGAFSIRSASGTTIARLGEGTGGGLFQLADQAGNAMVEAGIHPSGVGLVRTHPIGSPGLGMVGMPGTFLLGRPGNK